MSGGKARQETCWGAGRQFLGQEAPRPPSPEFPSPENRGASVCPPFRCGGTASRAGRASLPPEQEVRVRGALPPPWQRGRVWGARRLTCGHLPPASPASPGREQDSGGEAPHLRAPPLNRGRRRAPGAESHFSGQRVPPPLPLAPRSHLTCGHPPGRRGGGARQGQRGRFCSYESLLPFPLHLSSPRRNCHRGSHLLEATINFRPPRWPLGRVWRGYPRHTSVLGISCHFGFQTIGV